MTNNNEYSDSKESGLSTISVLIALAISSFSLLLISNHLNQTEKIIENIKINNELNSLRLYIGYNFSCFETSRNNNAPCNGSFIDLYAKNSQRIIEKNGSNIGNLKVRVNCATIVGGFEYEMHYQDLREAPPRTWRKLSVINLACHDIDCPTVYSGNKTLVEAESGWDASTGELRCSYLYDSGSSGFSCPDDYEMEGITNEGRITSGGNSRYFWFDHKHRSRYVDGDRILDCYYGIFCNNPAKSQWVDHNSCW